MTRWVRVDRLRRPLRRAVSVVALVVAGAVAAAPALAAPSTAGVPAAQHSPGVFGIGPANATKVDGRPYYYYLAQPGSIVTDHVAVENIGVIPITLSVYATDASNASDGSFSFPAAAVKPVEAGSWLRVGSRPGISLVTVKPRTTVVLPVTMTVPANAQPGDHAGALIASLQGQVRNSNGQLVHLDQRVATRVFVRIAGPLHPQLTIEQLHASYHGSLNPFATGTVDVTYRVHNTGNVKLGGKQLVTVGGLLGSTAAAKTPDVPLLLPGGSVVQSVTVHGVLPRVWMTSTVTVTAAVLPGDVDPVAGPWSASTHFWAVPWAFLALLVLAVVLGALLYTRRRRGSRPVAGGDGTGGAPSGPGRPGPQPPSTEREQDQVSA